MRLPYFLAPVLLATALHADEPRRVSAGGAITETICALGAEKSLVAVDVSSVYPEEVTKLPQIGYARQLSAEGILSANPTEMFLAEDAGPPAVIEQVEKAGVKLVKLSAKHGAEPAEDRIIEIGKVLGQEAKAEELVTKIKADLKSVEDIKAKHPERPKVLFIYARGGGTMNVAGTDTAADSIITLAGAENAVKDYTGYKPLTAEGAVAAEPDYILVTTRGLQTSGGVDALLEQPGLAATPAGKAKRVISMDDLYLLGFGPRFGEAAKDLAEKLHPDAPKS